MNKSADIEMLMNRIREIECGSSAPRATSSARAERDENEAPAHADAFKKIVALVNASDKSEFTLRSRLKREGFGESEIETAIERARELGFIDDLRYADVLIRSRLNQGKGAAGIERELQDQNIDIAQVSGWPFEYEITDESEFQRALDLLERNPPRSKNKRDGAYRKLVQKGFATSVASSAARTWSESISE